jgi:agmatinase
MVFTHTKTPYAFMGAQSKYSESKAVVIPVPYEGTVSYRGGTKDGPHAMITASRQVEFYDWELKKEAAFEFPIHTMDEVEPSTNSPLETVKRVEEAVAGVVEDKKFPIVFGGEHSITTGPVLALKKKYKNLSVLHIDAHLDLRDAYEDSKYNHASVMRRVRENIDKEVHVGIRSISKEEWDFIEKSKLQEYVYRGKEFDENKIVKQLTDEVYVSIDIDGFDPSEVPGVGTPEPGGLSWNDGLRLLRKVCENKKIVGFDIVEVAPIPGSVQSEFFAAKLAYKLYGYAMYLKK